jgi:hypothetical protein
MKQQNEQKKQETKSEAEKRREEIKKRQPSMEGRVRSTSAFASWQNQMEQIQTRAGKRNIVNTYVWDGDGGLRVEEQSFASIIEHSMTTEINISGNFGGSVESAIAGFKFALKLVGQAGGTTTVGKTWTQNRALELAVDLSGVEKNGITDARDNPLVPGEKVDRYRFMTFYLEGSTDHFEDFFAYVVDPEWLMSNDEEARALRQARVAKPNKCWRVLHRVTYVERPALLGFGREHRPITSTREAIETVTSQLTGLEKEQKSRLDELEDKIDQILAKV